jgi:hypothetical protein
MVDIKVTEQREVVVNGKCVGWFVNVGICGCVFRQKIISTLDVNLFSSEELFAISVELDKINGVI